MLMAVEMGKTKMLSALQAHRDAQFPEGNLPITNFSRLIWEVDKAAERKHLTNARS